MRCGTRQAGVQLAETGRDTNPESTRGTWEAGISGRRSKEQSERTDSGPGAAPKNIRSFSSKDTVQPKVNLGAKALLDFQ